MSGGPVSIKVRAQKLGGHWHVEFWSSEFGPESSHGKNGTLVFRETEWPAFQAVLETGTGAHAVVATDEPAVDHDDLPPFDDD
jgi:hypothetical protein